MTVQALVCIVGLYFLFSYFVTDSSLISEIEESKIKAEQIQVLEELSKNTVYPAKKSNENLKNFYFNLGRLEKQVSIIDHPDLTKAYKEFEKNSDTLNTLKIPKQVKTAEFLQPIDMIYQLQSRNKVSLIFCGILALIFGFLVPAFIFGLAGKTLKNFHSSLQKQAAEISANWVKELERFDGDAFKNLKFWINISLMAVTRSSRLSNHPGFNLVGDIAEQIKLELEKQIAEQEKSRGENIHSL